MNSSRPILAISVICITAFLISATSAPAHDANDSATCKCHRYQFDTYNSGKSQHYWRVFDTQTGEIWRRQPHNGTNVNWEVFSVPGDG